MESFREQRARYKANPRCARGIYRMFQTLHLEKYSSHPRTYSNLKWVTLNDNAHTFVNLPRGYFTVTTNRVKNAGWKSCHPLSAPPPTNRTLDDSLFSVAYLHHYATKSMEEFVKKSNRHVTGKTPLADMGGRLGLDYFFKINSHSKPGPECALPRPSAGVSESRLQQEPGSSTA